MERSVGAVDRQHIVVMHNFNVAETGEPLVNTLGNNLHHPIQFTAVYFDVHIVLLLLLFVILKGIKN
jgi:hypothetical protein